MGFAAGLHYFYGHLRIPDAAAYQGGIKYQSFHKAVSGTAQNLILVRLSHASGRIGAAVDGKAFAVSVHKKAGNAGQDLDRDFGVVSQKIHLSIGNKQLGKLMGCLGNRVRL